jgi:hypothetical protein
VQRQSNEKICELMVEADGDNRIAQEESELLRTARCCALAAENSEKHRMADEAIQQGVTTTE